MRMLVCMYVGSMVERHWTPNTVAFEKIVEMSAFLSVRFKSGYSGTVLLFATP